MEARDPWSHSEVLDVLQRQKANIQPCMEAVEEVQHLQPMWEHQKALLRSQH